MAVSITRGAESYTNTVTTTTGATGFTLYNSNTTSNASANNLYANNLQVVPEPSSLALIGLGGLAMMRLIRRRA